MAVIGIVCPSDPPRLPRQYRADRPVQLAEHIAPRRARHRPNLPPRTASPRSGELESGPLSAKRFGVRSLATAFWSAGAKSGGFRRRTPKRGFAALVAIPIKRAPLRRGGKRDRSRVHRGRRHSPLRWQISTDGGGNPRWVRGNEIIFQNGSKLSEHKSVCATERLLLPSGPVSDRARSFVQD
jgi:hypothetical protein